MSALRNVTDATLVLADPPYEFVAWQELLDATMADLVVAESDRELGGADAPFVGWTQTRVKRYGRAFVTFLQR
jgi:16S rRNA G966 N2-methylase RsmD